VKLPAASFTRPLASPAWLSDILTFLGLSCDQAGSRRDAGSTGEAHRDPQDSARAEVSVLSGDLDPHGLLGGRADGDALLGDRLHRGPSGLESVLLLLEVLAQDRSDLGGAAGLGIRDQRLVDRDLVML